MAHHGARMACEVGIGVDHLDLVARRAQGRHQVGVEPVFEFQRGRVVPQVLPRSQRGAVTAACRS